MKTFKLIANLPTGNEVIEEGLTRKEAVYLKAEYSMAFNCPISIKRER